MLDEVRKNWIFIRTYQNNPTAVGALLPSGRMLARALTGPLNRCTSPTRNVLEVGPGTGIVTQTILPLLTQTDHMDIVELEEDFIDLLNHRFRTESLFQNTRNQVAIHHMSLQDFSHNLKDRERPLSNLSPSASCDKRGSLDIRKDTTGLTDTDNRNQDRSQHEKRADRGVEPTRYDFIVSGLPLNNFTPECVEEVFDIFRQLLKPGGTLSYFEYMFFRSRRKPFSSRLQAIHTIVQKQFHDSSVQRDWVWRNVTPAWVHHLQFPSPKS